MTELQQIFKIQFDFNKKLYAEKFNLDFEKIPEKQLNDIIKNTVLSCGKEVFEILDEIKWKNHRIETINENDENYLEECVDAVKFLVNLVMLKGYSSEQFFNKFLDKSKVVDFRYEQEKSLQELKSSNQKIAIIDIDGVLNNYPINFINFIDKCEGIKIDSLHSFSSKNQEKYKELKSLFRKSGEEALYCKENCKSIEFLNNFSSITNVKIVLLTARPYKKYTNLFVETLEWLKRNNVKFDYLFFADNKLDFIEENFKQNQVNFIVDDQIENVNELSRFYDNVFYFENHLINENKILFKNVKTVKKLEEILKYI